MKHNNWQLNLKAKNERFQNSLTHLFTKKFFVALHLKTSPLAMLIREFFIINNYQFIYERTTQNNLQKNTKKQKRYDQQNIHYLSINYVTKDMLYNKFMRRH
jgi:hypothetical protein